MLRKRLKCRRNYHRLNQFEARVKREGLQRMCMAMRRLDRQAKSRLVALHKAALGVARKQHRRIQAKLKRTLRRRFEKCMRHCKHKSAWVQRLTGIPMAGLRAHLEAQFKPGMTWENHSFTGWHIDHKVPLASFDLADLDQRARAFHYTNLQPLWAKENLTKQARTGLTTVRPYATLSASATAGRNPRIGIFSRIPPV